MMNSGYIYYFSFVFPFVPVNFINTSLVPAYWGGGGFMYAPLYIDFSLKTYDPKGFELAKKQCGDRLARDISPRTKRYAESYGIHCTFFGETLNRAIYNFHKLNFLKMMAEQGQAKDQYHLAEAYYYGWYSSRENNEQKALFWYKKSSDQGFPDAEYHMAWRYERGEGVQTDFSKAMDLYRKAAMHGSEGAQLILADKYYYGSSLPFGTSIEKNDKEAAKWYEKAAEQGDRNACYMIGMMYQHGLGVSQDYKKAWRWFHRGIENGSAESNFGLGTMYAKGQGTLPNRMKARYYFKQACKDRMQEACLAYRKIKP